MSWCPRSEPVVGLNHPTASHHWSPTAKTSRYPFRKNSPATLKCIFLPRTLAKSLNPLLLLILTSSFKLLIIPWPLQAWLRNEGTEQRGQSRHRGQQKIQILLWHTTPEELVGIYRDRFWVWCFGEVKKSLGGQGWEVWGLVPGKAPPSSPRIGLPREIHKVTQNISSVWKRALFYGSRWTRTGVRGAWRKKGWESIFHFSLLNGIFQSACFGSHFIQGTTPSLCLHFQHIFCKRLAGVLQF